MICTMDKHGYLTIYPESEMEEFALKVAYEGEAVPLPVITSYEESVDRGYVKDTRDSME